MRESSVHREPAMLAAFVRFGWALLFLALLMIVANLVLLYGGDALQWVDGDLSRLSSPTLEAMPILPPPPSRMPSGM